MPNFRPEISMNPNFLDALRQMRQPMSRRQALMRGGFGLGSLALAGVLSDLGLTSANAAPVSPLAVSPLAPRAPQFSAKAKRVIHLFMNGGPSQMDTFDPKPKL